MGTMVFYLIFLPLFYYYYIFYVCGSLCTIEKIYNNNKIMVKKMKIKIIKLKTLFPGVMGTIFLI